MSVGVSGGCASGVSSPWSRIIGGLCVVTCRSDAPRSIISRRKASMDGIAVGEQVACHADAAAAPSSTVPAVWRTRRRDAERHGRAQQWTRVRAAGARRRGGSPGGRRVRCADNRSARRLPGPPAPPPRRPHGSSRLAARVSATRKQRRRCRIVAHTRDVSVGEHRRSSRRRSRSARRVGRRVRRGVAGATSARLVSCRALEAAERCATSPPVREAGEDAPAARRRASPNVPRFQATEPRRRLSRPW